MSINKVFLYMTIFSLCFTGLQSKHKGSSGIKVNLHKTHHKGKTNAQTLLTDPLYRQSDGTFNDLSAINTVLNNFQAVTYTTYLYFGSGNVGAELLVDTGTGWVTVASQSCLTCRKQIYNPEYSNTSHSVNTGTTMLDYGERTMLGKTFVDSICIDAGQKYCSPQIEFFGIKDQVGMDYLDGILGLAPELQSGPPSFLGTLKRNNVIEHKLFSLYIGIGTEQSILQFGGYDSFQVKKGKDDDGLGLHWYTVENDAYWILDLESCIYGDGSINGGREVEAVLDTGSAFIYLHNQDFNVLYGTWTEYIKGIQCSSQICFIEGTCADLAPKLKDFKFRFSGEWYFVVPPSQYLIDGATLDMNGFCVIGIQGGIDDDSPYILGNVFLRNFYVVYDMENKKVGISLHQNSGAKVVEKSNTWIVVVIIVIVVLVAAIIAYCLYKRRQSESEDGGAHSMKRGQTLLNEQIDRGLTDEDIFENKNGGGGGGQELMDLRK